MLVSQLRNLTCAYEAPLFGITKQMLSHVVDDVKTATVIVETA